jgi:hypothetical protein
VRLDNCERGVVIGAAQSADLDIRARNTHEGEQEKYRAAEKEEAASQVQPEFELQDIKEHQAASATSPFVASSVEK